MGTHPIFESDFDCLTENSEKSDIVRTYKTAKIPEKVQLFNKLMIYLK